jgi:hypothetical protein
MNRVTSTNLTGALSTSRLGPMDCNASVHISFGQRSQRLTYYLRVSDSFSSKAQIE